MTSHLNAIKISDKVYWVGAIDWAVRNFHGYQTSRGTTYNAYLIMADKITLVDTVKAGFKNEMLARIASVIDPKKIECLISNHAEPDHSGSLKETIQDIQPQKVFASKAGVVALKQHYGDDLQIEAVQEGSTLNLGNDTIHFVETKMLHWPDSMFSYLAGDKLLFSQDAFGMHLATSERFVDELPWGLLEHQAREYYANILTLYSPHILRLFEKLAPMNLKLDIVAPDHGPVFRTQKSISKILSLYQTWAARKPAKKVVIVYDTMWGSTHIMARAIEDAIKTAGVSVITLPLSSTHRTQVAHEALDAAALIVGSPTLNNNIFPTVADTLTYLRGLKFGIKYGAVFGAYGWSGEALGQLKDYLKSMAIEVLDEVKSQYVPTEQMLAACGELGKMVANKIM